jgi:hypothetical protein
MEATCSDDRAGVGAWGSMMLSSLACHRLSGSGRTVVRRGGDKDGWSWSWLGRVGSQGRCDVRVAG